MACPYLKEVVMLFCDAYPEKKMLPLGRLATANPCLGGEFHRCAFFQEVMAHITAAAQDGGPVRRDITTRKEESR